MRHVYNEIERETDAASTYAETFGAENKVKDVTRPTA